MNKELTKAEEELMQIAWSLEGGFVKDFIEKYPDPKPAYNTVSTIARILVEKGFLQVETYGKSHRYLPRVGKETYSEKSLSKLMNKYFNGSITQLMSFFAEKKGLNEKEVEELKNLINQKNG